MLGSLQDAEDVVQETWLRAWRRLETFQYHVSFRAWLYKIATHICLDTLEKRPRRTLPAAAYPVADPRRPIATPPKSPSVWSRCQTTGCRIRPPTRSHATCFRELSLRL